jgi:hypothetical protein
MEAVVGCLLRKASKGGGGEEQLAWSNRPEDPHQQAHSLIIPRVRSSCRIGRRHEPVDVGIPLTARKRQSHD